MGFRSGSVPGCRWRQGTPGKGDEERSAAIVPVVDEGLGNSAYLVDLGEGRAQA